MRKPKRFYSLKHPKLRQSWNKHNLYNIARKVGDEPPMFGKRTLFQQKWNAKSRSRAYHGEHIAEKKWVRTFDRRLNSAVDMPPQYLAANDGSEQGSGRGSGLSTSDVSAETYWQVPMPGKRGRPSHPAQKRNSPIISLLQQPLSDITPYMQMTYAPLERRLDTAVFRAMFASSVRQARQFVIHGAVTVNGKKMVHPSYLLNPGDMFQVEVEKVLYGTGMAKEGNKEAHSAREREDQAKREAKQNANALNKFMAERAGEVPPEEDTLAVTGGDIKAKLETVMAKKAAAAESPTTPATEAAADATTETAAEAAESSSSPEATNSASKTTEEQLAELSEEEQLEVRASELERVLWHVKAILRETNTHHMSAWKKRKLVTFREAATRFLGHTDKNIDMKKVLQELESEMKQLHLKISTTEEVKEAERQDGKEGEEASTPKVSPKVKRAIDRVFGTLDLDEKFKDRAIRMIGYEPLSSDEIRKLGLLLKEEAENPTDASKPYRTPWQPRPYMSAFAFVPRYLEVNPNICAAVYLRHPVARKGVGEVPTPFHYFTSQLTHNWYLGRG